MHVMIRQTIHSIGKGNITAFVSSVTFIMDDLLLDQYTCIDIFVKSSFSFFDYLDEEMSNKP